MGKLPPGNAQQVVPTPHCGQGHVVHAGGAKYPRHPPAAHTWLALQATSQSPQLIGSRCSCAGDRQALLQFCRPMVEQPTSWHTPSTHDLSQAAPHAPQCLTSLVTSTHEVSQRVSPGRQAHVPSPQNSATPQLAPQAPQLVGLVSRLTQALPQVSAPVQSQAPWEQVEPVPHAVLQLPQNLGSLSVSTQLPLHTVLPAGQAHAPDWQLSPGAHL